MRQTWKSPWLWALVGLAFVEMVGLSLIRFYGFNMRGFDLGNISQSVWSVTQGRPLIMTSIGSPVSRLSGNVEIIYLLLAPIYALFPSPAALLVTQAAFYAAGALPLYRLARRRLAGEGTAVLIAAIYLLYPVGQTAVLFEFHADVLAMPLLLLAIEAADRRAWRGYALWLLLALSCKFYVAVPVAVMGFVLWRRGERRAGAATAAAGIIWGLFAFLVMRPLFAAEITTPVVAASGGAVRFYGVTFGQLDLVRLTAAERLADGLIVFMPVLLVGWRALPWLLPAAALVLPVLLGNGPGPIYDYRYHHYAVAVPFLLAALVYGLEQLAEKRAVKNGRPPGYLILSFIITLLFNVAFVDTPLNPNFYAAAPGSALGRDSSGYRIAARDQFKRDWLTAVPPDAVVLTDNTLGLPLVNRPTLYLAEQLTRPLDAVIDEVDVALFDALFDFVWANAGRAGDVAHDYAAIGQVMRNPDFRLAAAQDGLLRFERGAAAGLAAQVETRPGAAERPLLAQFDDAIGLVDVTIEARGNNRFQMQIDWTALRPLSSAPPLIAVSRPGGLANARIVHRPTLALLPTTAWPADQIVRETFEFTLPPDAAPGRYPLFVGWYDTDSLFAPATAARSRVGDEVQIGWLTVP